MMDARQSGMMSALRSAPGRALQQELQRALGRAAARPGPHALAMAAADWAAGVADAGLPLWRRALRAALLAAPLTLLMPRTALAGILDDAVRSGLQGMLDYVVMRVNSMAAQTLPTEFSNLFDGYAGSHQIYAKALSLYATGVAKAVASSILSLVMLVQLVKITQRAEASSTMPAVREVVTLLVACAVYTFLVGHAWELMAALFADLSRVWRGWTAASPVTVDEIDIGGLEGLAALLPMFLSTTVCLLLADVAAVATKVVCWCRGIQLYFLATMSPIPLALLGIEETRHMGVAFLKNYCALVLGYASLAFVLDTFPALMAMAVETSWQAGGPEEMILTVTVSCVLQVLLVLRCGSWARDLLGG